ncbi:MAG: hydroxypyruvate isomerase [Alphaproteobacteria bacterium]|nr:hydroxypyruvate isomerase [Alphaproteobacteria bacterium]
MPRLAANLTMMFNEWDFLDRFAAAADSGFDAVEFLFPYDHAPELIAKLLQDHRLTQALFNCPPGDWAKGERGIASLTGREDEFRRSIDQALIYAGATGVKRLHVMSGLSDRHDPVALETYRTALIYACEKAQKQSIDIMIEPINGRDMPGYFLNDFNFAAALIANLALPNLKLQYDIYHRQILHGDVMKSLEVLMPIIGHIQIAAVPLRHEPMSGELDDARVLRYLDHLGYQGFVGLEYRPANGTREGLAWRDDFMKAV